MPVKVQPTQFVSHGKAFDNQADAHRHDKLYQAREELEAAQRKFQRLLAENAVTADGHRFEFGVFRDYYHIVRPHMSRPYLRKYDYLCWNWSVREQVDAPEVVEIRDERSDGSSNGGYVPIRELYADEKKARAALIRAQREWLEEQRREIESK